MPAISGLSVEGIDRLHAVNGKLAAMELARDAFTGTSREHRSLVWLHDALGKPGIDFGSDRFCAELYVRLWYLGARETRAAQLMVDYAALRAEGPRPGRRSANSGGQTTHQEAFHALATNLGLWDERQSPEDLARQVRRTRQRLKEAGIAA
ncbi:MAG TPA: hypothetical protein VJY35_09955 [Candidatus Eisenbacteria bacterium]|nr:hypothetical protein [Candidatus Eisenbacteria bacterium]